MASFIYTSFIKKTLDGTNIDFTSNTIKVALTTASYTPNQATHDFFDDITNEVSGTGYSAGGATLGSKTVTLDTTNKWVVFDAADVSLTTSTISNARYAVIYKSTGVASTSPLIALIDFGSNQSTNASTFAITWSTDGIFKLTIV